MGERAISGLSAIVSFLAPYPWWVKLALSGWLIFGVLLLLVIIFVAPEKSDERAAPNETAPATAAASAPISDFQAYLKLVVVGSWVQDKPPTLIPLVVGGNEPYLTFRHQTRDPVKEIHLFPTYVESFDHGNGRARVEFRASVQPGEFPLGQNIDLRSYDHADVALPVINKPLTKDGKLVLEGFEMTLFVNGVRRFAFSEAPNAPLTLPDSGFRFIGVNGGKLFSGWQP